jgi:hypothetical protein
VREWCSGGSVTAADVGAEQMAMIRGGRGAEDDVIDAKGPLCLLWNSRVLCQENIYPKTPEIYIWLWFVKVVWWRTPGIWSHLVFEYFSWKRNTCA